MNINNFVTGISVCVFGLALFFAARSQSYEKSKYDEKNSPHVEGHDHAHDHDHDHGSELDIPKGDSEETPSLSDAEKEAGVVMTASGLKYKILKVGEGVPPGPSDQVKVHYKGTLKSNGNKFDSSYDRNQPAVFGVSDVIPGWVEALQLMKPGAKWQLIIPSKLAYGAQGAGSDIPPNSTLLFDVELIEVLK